MGRGRTRIVRALAVALAAALAAIALTVPGGEPGVEADARTLLLALDGVSYRAAVLAQSQGAFEGWTEVRPLISTFPSMTNVAFTAMLEPFGEPPIAGYEVRHFAPRRNRLVRGIFGYDEHKYPWRDRFDFARRSTTSKLSVYLRPNAAAEKSLERIERIVLESPDDLVLAHVASTDVMSHFHGDTVVVPFLVDLSGRLDALERRHAEARGRPLRVLIVSDHGNGAGKVRHAEGIRDVLEKAGFRIRKKLEGPDDAVFPTYGVVNYGVLYTRPPLAEKAARAVASHPNVTAAAWLAGDGELRVRNHHGEASIRWRGEFRSREFSYDAIEGDPLGYAAVLDRLRGRGELGEDGFAGAAAWLEESALEEFPDAPRRLVDSLTGRFVRNAASVIFGTDPNHALGLLSARIGARLRGGLLEGTHGGLDGVSSRGIILSTDPALVPATARRVDEVLGDWAIRLRTTVWLETDTPCCDGPDPG